MQTNSNKIVESSILLVDDDPLILTALEVILEKEGYQVMTAKNGEEALHILSEQAISLIICDQKMPGMSGIEVLKRAQVIQPDTIRILLTAFSDLKTVLQAINIGQVSQFIVKPWDNLLLKQIVHNSVEKHHLIKENQNLNDLILEQHSQLAKAHVLLRQDLQLGGRIHENLLLGKVPAHVNGVDIQALSIPSRDIDGDFFDFYFPLPSLMDIVVGDVMGKGIPAALVGTAVKTQLLRFAVPYAYIQMYDHQSFWEEYLLKPHQILENVHREIVPQLIQLEYFVSLFYGRFDLAKNTFSYVDCGSAKPMHYRANEKQVVYLRGPNFPLGMVEANNYLPIAMRYEENDIFAFFSDGVTEAKAPNGELYGIERLSLLLTECAQKNSENIINAIKESVFTFSQRQTFEDDFTIIVIKMDHCPIPKITTIKTVKFTSSLEQLSDVREFIASLCLDIPGNKELFRNQLQLAINEIFCNIVKHGYRGSPNHEILICGEISNDGITIEFSDTGETFDPARLPEPSLAGDKESGFGWFMIKKIADQITYIRKERERDRNHLKVFKKFILEEVPMQLSHAIHEDVLVITPTGENLDAKEAPDFKAKALELIHQENHNHIVFDLSHLQFVDSSGLGSFLSVLRAVHSNGGELKLAKMSKAVRTMFELVSMHKIFEIHNSIEDAVRSFKQLQPK
jgi:anti-anti-sigma factor